MGATYHGTTILAVRKGGRVALAGDGQISIGDTIVKAGASKVRTLKGGKILAGFAGSVADAITLFDRFESQLDRHPGNLTRAATRHLLELRTRLSGSIMVVVDLVSSDAELAPSYRSSRIRVQPANREIG